MLKRLFVLSGLFIGISTSVGASSVGLDPTFGQAGVLSTNLSDVDVFDQHPYDSILQKDGKIVVVGVKDRFKNSDLYLVRYNSDGSLDTNFGDDGYVTTDIANLLGEAKSIIQQDDGKLVVTGYNQGLDGYKHIVLIRYNTDGSLDNTFGNQGIVMSDIHAEGNAVIQQKDRKLVVAGTTYDPEQQLSGRVDFVLMRFNSDGMLDNTFGEQGIVVSELTGGKDIATTLIQQANGKLVVAGQTGALGAGDIHITLVRYNNDGSIDTSFNKNGVTRVVVGCSYWLYESRPYALIQQADGKLVVAGHLDTCSYNPDVYHDGDQYDSFLALARIESNGTLDTNFGSDGVIYTERGNFGKANSIVQQSDGKLLVAGAVQFNGERHAALFRYNTDGTFDSSFEYNYGLETNKLEEAVSLLQQADGRLMVVGYAYERGGTAYSGPYYASRKGNKDIAIMRLEHDGSVDAAFADEGIMVDLLKSDDGPDYIEDIILQSDGKLLSVGATVNSNNKALNLVLMRHNIDSSLDNTFGENGLVTVEIAHFASDNVNFSIVQQANNKFIVAGKVDDNITLLRFDKNGLIDISFGDNGFVNTDLDTRNEAPFMTVQEDGKLVVLGRFYMARYNSTGKLDTSFGDNGKIVLYFPEVMGGVSLSGKSIIQQIDGKLIIVGEGQSREPNLPISYAMTRYNTNGTLDMSFGDEGLVFADINGDDVTASSVRLQKDGKLIMIGTNGINNSEGKSDMFLARYNSDGYLDVDFGNQGIVITDVEGSSDIGHSVAVLENDKLLVVGSTSKDNESRTLIARYHNDGSLDLNFAENGIFINESCTALTDLGNTLALDTLNLYLPIRCGSLDISVAKFILGVAPVIVQGDSMEVSISEGTPSIFTIDAIDEDGDTLTWAVAKNGVNGVVSIQNSASSGEINYVPNSEFSGKDSFQILVKDGEGGMDTIHIDVTVTPTLINLPDSTSRNGGASYWLIVWILTLLLSREVTLKTSNTYLQRN